MTEPMSIDWQATLSTGETVTPATYQGRPSSPWSYLKDECLRQGKWIVDLVFRYGRVRYPLGANADGYWMAGSVRAVMGQPELCRSRVGVGRVEGDTTIITWFIYPGGVEYERRPATDKCIIWKLGKGPRTDRVVDPNLRREHRKRMEAGEFIQTEEPIVPLEPEMEVAEEHIEGHLWDRIKRFFKEG